MEQKKIKGSKSSYYKQSEKRNIERTSKYINLGVNSAFDVGDVAFILSETEYTNLNELANTDATKEIAKLKETITELNKQIANLTDDKETLTTTNNDLANKLATSETQITELNNRIRQTEKELSKYTAINVDDLQQKATELETSNNELNKEIKTKTDYIVYLEQLQTDYTKLIAYHKLYFETYKHRNILKRIANTDVNSDIDKPMLKHLDFKGNPTNKDNAPIIATAKPTDANSE